MSGVSASVRSIAGRHERAGQRRNGDRQRPADRRPGDRHQLLADVDPDGTPRDAAAAADAARRPKLVEPGRELVGQPLAVAVLRPRPEVAPGDLGKVAREAGIPAPLGDRLDAVQVRDLAHARAEAGRADQRAVGAGEAALGDLRPVRVVEAGHQPSGQALDRDRVADRLAHGRDRRPTLPHPIVAGRRQRQPLGQRPAARGGRPHEEPVIELGQDEVGVVAGDLGAGAHRGAEARGPGDRALDRDDQRRPPAGRVVGVRDRALHQDPVLDAQRRQLAAAHAEEGQRPGIRLDGLECRPVAVPPGPPDRDAGRERVALPAGRTHRVAERPLAVALRDPVPARRLLVTPADRQVGRRRDLVVDDRPVLDGGGDDRAALVVERLDERAQVRPRQEARPGGAVVAKRRHHARSSVCPNRSSSWRRVPSRRRATLRRMRG